ncbi:MAG TPA: sulfite exporter TauE/SafE family protein [Bacilli bacterium]|nr:sulfite exporter TauE/SafE family protein [Bacilli bacterium]
MFYAIPAALGLGALHALEPGHGKGVMTAYLVSSRARFRDAVLLGFTSAVSHTLSILFLAFLATTAMQYVLPEQVEAWLGLVSGAIITVIGLRMVYQRLNPPVVSLGGLRGEGRGKAYVCAHGHVHHEVAVTSHERHGYGHQHEHANHHDGHAHDDGALISGEGATSNSKRHLLTMGVLTGLIPCPSALAILLAAIANGTIPTGVGLVVAFSLGGAIALSTLGILILKAEHRVRALERRRIGDLMAGLSACLIVVIGFLVTYESLMKLGWM